VLVDECLLIRREDVGNREEERRKIEFNSLSLTAFTTPQLYMDSSCLVSFPNFTLWDRLKQSIRQSLGFRLYEDHTGTFQQAYVSLYGSYSIDNSYSTDNV
jgi:hypothetical protein